MELDLGICYTSDGQSARQTGICEGYGMDIEIKKMETEEETRGKAYVHWRAWHEVYPGLVSQELLAAINSFVFI